MTNSTQTEYIAITDDICGGQPCIAGRRITTHMVFSLFMKNIPIEEIENAFELTAKQVLAAIQYEGLKHAN